MSFGSAGYSTTFSGDFSLYLADKLKQRFDKLRRARKARKVKSKKLLGRKKQETSEIAKTEELNDTIKPGDTTADLEKKLLPPAEEDAKVEKEAVSTVEGKGVFDGLVKSLEGLRAANAAIKQRLAELLKTKDKQNNALAVVGKNQYEDEVIDVEFVELDQKRLKEADEDTTVKAFGTSAIVKKEKKTKGPLMGFIEKVQNVLGGIGKAIGNIIKNPLALAGIAGTGLILADAFGSAAQAADGSITIGGDSVNALTPFLNLISGNEEEEEGEDPVGSEDYERAEEEIAALPQDTPVPSSEDAPAPVAGGRDLSALAAISALESGSRQGQADVAQSVYNRLADSGDYGDSIFEVLTRDKQYQPAFVDPNASSGAGTKTSQEFKNIRDEGTAVTAMQSYYRKRGINKSREQVTQEYRSALGAIQDPALQASARQHVGGRTEFLSSNSDTSRERNVAFRGGRSDNKFFAAYGSQTQMARGAMAPPAELFSNANGYQAPIAPSTLSNLGDRLDQAVPNIIFIPNTDIGIPVPSVGGAVRGVEEFIDDPLENLKQFRLWGGN